MQCVHKRKSPGNTPGFALIATISVMVLLVMIALAMLSLSTIELRSSRNGGAMAEAQALLPNLRLSPMKKVVNISTRAASPGGAAYGYRISKTALNMVTRCMSVDAGMRGLIVIALAPGHNKTDMGTHRGNLDPAQSMKKVKALIESLTPKHHGKLWFYDGSPMRW